MIAATGNLMMRQLSPTIVAMIQVAYDHGETRIRYGANLGVPHVAAALAIRDGDADLARRRMSAMLYPDFLGTG